MYLDPVDYFSFVLLLHSIKTDFVTRLCWVRECRTIFLGSLSIATVNSLDCMRKTGLLRQCFLLFFYCSVRCSAFSFFLFFLFSCSFLFFLSFLNVCEVTNPHIKIIFIPQTFKFRFVYMICDD